MPVATNQETGRDQAAAEGYLRRLAVLDKEVCADLVYLHIVESGME